MQNDSRSAAQVKRSDIRSALSRASGSAKSCAANIRSLRAVAAWFCSQRSKGPSAAEVLGYGREDRLLIVNADDFGLCHEQNLATIEGLRAGGLTSASVMVPCPGFGEVRDYARQHPQADLGIHLTLNSEWEMCRWGPVCGADRVPSLVDDSEHFWRTSAEVSTNADPKEVETELRAQIESAFSCGIDITHLDSHMFMLHRGRADLRDIYLTLAQDYALPLRVAPRTLLHWYGFGSLSARADQSGILHPDNFAVSARVRPRRVAGYWIRLLSALPAGVTEICCHPAQAKGELKRFAADYQEREADFRFFCSPESKRAIAVGRIRLIGYRTLRDAMRAAKVFSRRAEPVDQFLSLT